jgi:uncharacterized protein YjiK
LTNILTIRSVITNLYSLAFGPNGYIYATVESGYRIVKIDPSSNAQSVIFSGDPSIQSEGNGLWRGCAFDNDGFIYCVTDGIGFIYKFNINGTLLGLFGTVNSKYGIVSNLTYDPINRVFYAVTTGGAVYRIDKYGNSILYTTVSNLSIYQICYHQTNRTFVLSGRTNTGGSNVYILTKYIPPQVSSASYSLSSKQLLHSYIL